MHVVPTHFERFYLFSVKPIPFSLVFKVKEATKWFFKIQKFVFLFFYETADLRNIVFKVVQNSETP